MDQQATTLLATLRRPAASSETKITLLNNLKSDIKHYRVPENAQAVIFECLKTAIAQQSSSTIISAAFSTLGHLIKRLKIQDADGKSIVSFAPKLLPALLERLGDQRDTYRQGASQALSDFWPFCAQDVEHLIREDAIGGTNGRTKQEAMHWVARMHQEENLQFKSFVGPMVACLEDQDGNVRDAAKVVLVELFNPASVPAKNDLKKQMRLHDVRISIVTQILQQIGMDGSVPPKQHHPEVDLAASTRSLPAFDHASQFAASINSEEARPPAPPEEVPMDPIFVHSMRELEDMMRDMEPHFEGKESEENWLLRDKDITKLRRLTKGNAPSEYHAAYMAGIKHLQEGTMKAANTLRTTLSTNACQLVQELARTLGPAMDAMVELYLQSFIKMCANTKQIAAQAGNLTTDTIFQYVSYNTKLMHHVVTASQDKNRAPRQFSAGWLRTILNRQAGNKSHFESSGGLEMAEKIIRRCLEDADPKVKESMRATYWTYAKLWPDKAQTMLNAVDQKVRTALERDSHNPNASHAASVSSFSASTTSRPGGARSSLRDRIAADKKAAAARQQPTRPVTAMASMTPAKSKSMANLNAGSRAMAPPVVPGPSRVTSNMSVSSTTSTRSVDTTTSTTSNGTMKGNSLMSGAARRPVKRPELVRPQTADPYATRKLIRPETPSNQSPGNSPRHATVGKSAISSSSAAKNRVGRTASPAASPLRQFTGSKSLINSRPASNDRKNDLHLEDQSLTQSDEFTMVLPTNGQNDTPASASRRRPMIDKTMSVDSGMHIMAEDDNFTMVLPGMSNGSEKTRARSPLAYRSPLRVGGEGSSIPLPSSPRSSLHVASPPIKPRSPADVRSSSARRATSERKDTPLDGQQVNGTPRASSPLKSTVNGTTSQQESEVEIYEDPFVAEVQAQEIAAAAAEHEEVSQPSNVLTERPVNDVQRPQTPPTTNGSHEQMNSQEDGDNALSPPRSPQSKAETLRARKLLQSGIERIKARTLDTHGFRKVTELTRTNEPLDLFGSNAESKRFDDLLGALCDYISTTPEISRPNTNASELKRQALNLIKSLITSTQPQYKKWTSSGAWAPRILTSCLQARRTTDGLPIAVKDIEAVSRECLRLNPTIEPLLAFLSSTPTDTTSAMVPPTPSQKSTASALALALKLLTHLLPISLSDNEATSLAQSTSPYLKHPDAEVRKRAVEAAVALHGSWPVDKAMNGHAGDEVDRAFWSAMGETKVDEGTRGLVLYYLARGRDVST